MVRVIHMQAIFGNDNEIADAYALSLAKRLEYRSTQLECPNGHKADDYPNATITVQSWDREGGRVSHSDMCCEEYYRLLLDQSVHVSPPSDKGEGEQ